MGVARGKIRLAAFDDPFPKTPLLTHKILQISFTQTIVNFVLNFVAMETGVAMGEI